MISCKNVKKNSQVFNTTDYTYFLFKSFSNKKNSLFDGDDFLFKKSIEGTKIYGEYGCGLSSEWVLRNTSSKIISVDSSIEWVEKVKTKNQIYKSRLIINAIDLGEIGN